MTTSEIIGPVKGTEGPERLSMVVVEEQLMTDGLVVTLARLADETAALKDTVYALVSREQADPPSELGAALISALASLRTAEDELRRSAQLAESESDQV